MAFERVMMPLTLALLLALAVEIKGTAWRPIKAMRTPRSHHGVAVVNRDVVCAIGGCTGGCNKPEPDISPTVECWNQNVDQAPSADGIWYERKNLTVPRMDHAVAALILNPAVLCAVGGRTHAAHPGGRLSTLASTDMLNAPW